MVGQVVDLEQFTRTAKALRELGATYVRVGDCEARWSEAPAAKAQEGRRARPLDEPEREELNELRAMVRREQEALSAS